MSASSTTGGLIFLAVILAADFFNVGNPQLVQRVGNRVQMPLRQVKILGGGLQVSVAEQHLNGSQVSATFEQVSRPAVS
jgi:hypothetical protein